MLLTKPLAGSYCFRWQMMPHNADLLVLVTLMPLELAKLGKKQKQKPPSVGYTKLT